jgi:23S rRNA pseudouridine2605 synthase
MRINKFIAQATGLSRRAADAAIVASEVLIGSQPATIGQIVTTTDTVTFHGKAYHLADIAEHTSVLLHKPVGFVVSRNGQGSPTIYELLPTQYRPLKPVGRLDKDSSGLLILTDDGALAHELTHPSRHKLKRYEITLDHSLAPLHRQMISEYGLQLDDGLSKFQLDRLDITTGDPVPSPNTSPSAPDTTWLVTMHEGRNRQIRRTFAALGYAVVRLHRIQFGHYQLNSLPSGQHQLVSNTPRQSDQ